VKGGSTGSLTLSHGCAWACIVGDREDGDPNSTVRALGTAALAGTPRWHGGAPFRIVKA
jgi:hypothetical protein